MSKKEVKIFGISNVSTQSQSYQLLMYNEESDMSIPIVIGAFEAQSIAIEIEDIIPPRPLTHDLISNIFKKFEISLKEIYIYKVEEGIFYSKLIFSDLIEIECRTSDGISIALREDVPIYIEEFILKEVGFKQGHLKNNTNNNIKNNNESKENLEKELQKAIDDEDYEKASKIKNKLKDK
jgi:uncharacterized protein